MLQMEQWQIILRNGDGGASVVDHGLKEIQSL
jgi:hypothetical protein